ncbi:hypothetical protein V6N13_039552 [Hibiscus sabdariffa]
MIGLWHALDALRPVNDLVWVLGGDFNAITVASERMGGSCRGDGVSANFNEFLQLSGLNDLGYHGPQFTWKRGTLHQRLDRCLGNDNWWNMWPSLKVIHLSRFGSDHRPVLLLTDPTSVRPRTPMFRYLAAWQSNEEFEALISAVWKSENSIVQNISVFQSRATQWNKNSFGHIGQRKRNLLARIRGLERVNENSVVPFLSDLEAKLRDDLSETLRQEEMLWFQRARTEWIRDGDRNTKYYHRVTKTRQRKKMCTMLKLDTGQWCSDQSIIRQEVVKFFKGVFLSSSVQDWDGNGSFNSLSEIDVANLMVAVQDEEDAFKVSV